ncbi:Putative membrane protein [Amycolatopsis japonica]|uniref:Putative membrane protein n=2 Tax=Amycolatopsis japonica TaxID=208439 RepID=A0A075V5G7_9PSEU|nr:Putative membrane protein [Amycolatopsis japonica]
MPGCSAESVPTRFISMKADSRTKHARRLLLCLHVLASVAWCTMQLAQLALLLRGWSSDGPARLATFELAEFLENTVLDPAAIVSAYTGMMLSALTSWGFFKHRWVMVKFVITVALLVIASTVVSRLLPSVVEALRAGAEEPRIPILVGTCGMACATAFLLWVSVVKPWGKTARHAAELKAKKARGRKEPEPSLPVYVAVLLIPAIEFGFALDYPILTFGTVIGYSIFKFAAANFYIPKVKC